MNSNNLTDTATATVSAISSPASIDSAYVLGLGKDRKAVILALIELGDDKATATATYNLAHRVRLEALTLDLTEKLANKSAMVIKTTRRLDGTLSAIIADGETLALARAKVSAKYAKLAAKALAKLS